MPFQPISDSSSTLTIIPYSRKTLYMKGTLYLILLYLIVDLNFGIISAINPEANMELLFSFQSIAIRYDINFQTIRNSPTLIVVIFGIFIGILLSFATIGMKFADIGGILIPPIKSKQHLYPTLVVLSSQGVEIHSKKEEQEEKKVFSWRTEIFSVLVKVPSQYRLRIILILSSTHLQDKTHNSQYSKQVIRLDRLFKSKKDRKRAATTLISYFQTYFPGIYNN